MKWLCWSLAIWLSLTVSVSAQTRLDNATCVTWPPQIVIDQLSRSVVAIKRGQIHGSGVLFAGSRQVITSLSVVDARGKILVTDAEGFTSYAHVAKFDREQDVAVLYLHRELGPRAEPLRKSALAQEESAPGQQLLFISRPAVPRTPLEGYRVLAATPGSALVLRREGDKLALEARTERGDRGAPVFTLAGQLLAIRTSDASAPYLVAPATAARAIASLTAPDEPFRPHATHGGMIGLGLAANSDGAGVDFRTSYRRDHLLLSAHSALVWERLQPTKSDTFESKRRVYVMGTVGGYFSATPSQRYIVTGGVAYRQRSRSRTLVGASESDKRNIDSAADLVRPVLDLGWLGWLGWLRERGRFSELQFSRNPAHVFPQVWPVRTRSSKTEIRKTVPSQAVVPDNAV